LFSDTDDWLRTAVAFANSCPTGFHGLLFVGVKEDGTVQEQQNVESVMNKVAKKINEAFPQIFYSLRILERDGRQFIAAIIPGSAERPHFVGGAYIRQGSNNMPASESLFSELIAQRNSKAYAILKWKGKQITAERRNVERVALVGEVFGYFEPVVEGCDSHSVKLRLGTPYRPSRLSGSESRMTTKETA
jgi:predicted HTH transcriptional regulator